MIIKNLLIVAGILSLCLTGCSVQSGELDAISTSSRSLEEAAEKQAIWEDIPMHLEENISETFKVNAEIVIPESCKDGTETVYSCQKIAFDKETVEGILYQESEVQNEYEMNLTDEVLGPYTNHVIELSGGGQLSIGGAYINYMTPLEKYLVNCLREDTSTQDYNMNVYPTSGDLEFMTKADAEQKVREILGQLGIDVSEKSECYLLKSDILRTQERCIDSAGNEVPEEKKGQWTKEDDCYYFVFHQEIEGSRIGFVPNEGNDSRIEVRYGKNGLVSLTVQLVYEQGQEKKEEKLLTPEEILSNLEKDRELLIQTAPMSVDKLQLIYLPVITGRSEMELRPVWNISATEKNEVVGALKKELFFDASTGKEILGS